MSDVEILRQMLAEMNPFYRTLDISITAASADRVELAQPEAPERINYEGTSHTAASVLFMLTEAMMIHSFAS